MRKKAFWRTGGMKLPLAAAVVFAAQGAAAQDPHAGETPRQKDIRMKWWREARFGMFIHWGLYAEPAGFWNGKAVPGLGEWIMNDAKIPVADYAVLAPKFNPVKFDADLWVAIAKGAGMKYVVMTAKHHDGFAMFRSADPFNIWDATPFKRDPIAEMAAACRKAGLKFGVYYSQAQDWSHPGGAAWNGGPWDPKQKGDLHAYVRDVAAPQMRELMRYNPAVLWWDTPVDMSNADLQLLTAPLPKGIIMNNRLGNGIPGDTETPEQTIPPTGFPGRDWETCMTINDTWGFKSNDTDFKSTQSLVQNLIDIASKGGNYLLNVGPDASGVIPAPEIQRLTEMGEWLKKNGRSIYGTTPSPYRRLPFKGRITVKGDSLFVHVFESSSPVLPGLSTRVKQALNVTTGAKVGFRQSSDGSVTLDPVPLTAGSLPTVIELKLAGKPIVIPQEIPYLEVASTGRIMTPEEADLTGGLQVEHTPSNIGYWTNPSDMAAWGIVTKEGFKGQIALTYACDRNEGGSTFTIQLDGKDTGISGKVQETGGWATYRKVVLDGMLDVPAGKHILRIKPVTKPGLAVMNLQSLELIPAQ
ncbi:carbohydrate-binding protein [bacterium]|nr:MAG: carbohydrate-binding protein [bacterium]